MLTADYLDKVGYKQNLCLDDFSHFVTDFCQINLILGIFNFQLDSCVTTNSSHRLIILSINSRIIVRVDTIF